MKFHKTKNRRALSVNVEYSSKLFTGWSVLFLFQKYLLFVLCVNVYLSNVRLVYRRRVLRQRISKKPQSKIYFLFSGNFTHLQSSLVQLAVVTIDDRLSYQQRSFLCFATLTILVTHKYLSSIVQERKVATYYESLNVVQSILL